MQTLTIKVKDDFIVEFMKMIDSVKENVIVQKDENLELDPYFYERQKRLQQIRDDIKSGKSKTTPLEDFELEMDDFVKELEEKYAS